MKKSNTESSKARDEDDQNGSTTARTKTKSSAGDELTNSSK